MAAGIVGDALEIRAVSLISCSIVDAATLVAWLLFPSAAADAPR